jgi:hypothetical protein
MTTTTPAPSIREQVLSYTQNTTTTTPAPSIREQVLSYTQNTTMTTPAPSWTARPATSADFDPRPRPAWMLAPWVGKELPALKAWEKRPV